MHSTDNIRVYNRLVGAIFIFLGIATLVILTIFQLGVSLALLDEIEVEFHHIYWPQFYDFVRYVSLILMVVVAAPSLVAGIALFNNKNWARKIALVLSIFYLFFFPVGTILALVSLVLLFQDEKSYTNTQGTGADLSQSHEAE